jgi:GNAT superfamily N-acetyltransferase
MPLTIRPSTEADFPAILELIRELAVFQGSPELVLNTVELMREEKTYFRCYVAEIPAPQEIVGIASYFFAYYTWVGKSLYLDDLYVKSTHRGQQIGSALLQKIFDTAREENCKRVRWMVSEWNTDALAFYEKRGAEIEKDLYICDFDRPGIEAFGR